MRVVGMDVHVRNSFLYAAEADGQVICRGRAGNTLAEIAQLLAPLEHSAEPVRAVLESTTNSRAIYSLMLQYAQAAGLDMSVQVLDARKLRVIAESVGKCDQHDAKTLCELARSNLKLPACYVPDEPVFALREHLRARTDLVRVRTMLKNRVHALLHRRGVLHPFKDVFTKAGRQWLASLTLDEAGRVILDRHLQLVDQLHETIAQSTLSLRHLARSQRWCGPCALLQTMPGVGPITALTILAELGDINRFKSRAAVSNFAGLVPVMRSSNDKQYYGGITHRGPAHLRHVLVEAAWIGQARVPQYAAIFNRITQRKGKLVAITAVARRMLEDAWTMLKRNEVFRCVDVHVRSGEMLAAPSVAG
jgi:transposase